MNLAHQPPASEESFSELFALTEDNTKPDRNVVGAVLKGVVVAINDNMVLVDVGLKAEGWVSLSEFRVKGSVQIPEIGEEIDVFVEKIEDKDGLAILSRERARREETWEELERKQHGSVLVKGSIIGRIRGGYTVDVDGVAAFLPGSQVDIRPVRDIAPLMSEPQEFQILKMNRTRGNIVVSRRVVIEEKRAVQRNELFANLKQGQVLEGIVKNITDYGAFVDLGGIDGLLHVTDMSWKRISHPTEIVSVGDLVQVKIIRYVPDSMRVSLGMKQLTPDPWEGIELKYPLNTMFTGKVSNITDYGVFVVLEDGVEGLIHFSELSWNKKNVHPSKITAVGEEILFVVLDIDLQKRRISLGHKQCLENPWEAFANDHSVGSKLKGTICNINEFGIFVSLAHNIEGMIHSSDVFWDAPAEGSWSSGFEKDKEVEVVLLEVDIKKGRVSLGIKQLTPDPFKEKTKEIRKGSVVTCIITQVIDPGLQVDVGGVRGFIKRIELSRLRSGQQMDRFAVGEKIDAVVTGIDESKRELALSVKAREISEMKSAMETYGSTDSGASLGDILTVALQEKEASTEQEKSRKKSSAKKSLDNEKEGKTTVRAKKQDTKESSTDQTASEDVVAAPDGAASDETPTVSKDEDTPNPEEHKDVKPSEESPNDETYG